MGAIEWVTSLIGTILYPLFSVVFLVIDVLQDIFGAFAGIDNIVYDGQLITSGNTGAETDTGIVYFLLTSDLAKNIFFSMLILAIILLLIFLAMAFIRNVYSEKTKNWKEIVGLAIKGIGNFIFIPVGALLGVWLGNIVLQAINGATASGNSLTISRQLFVCSAYNANKLRGEEYQNVQLSSDDPIIETVSKFCSQYGISVDTSQTDPAYYADCIDDAYGTGGPSISWYWEVDDWYSLFEINYLILVVGGIFILYALGALSFGMIKRLFMLLLLFVISPIVCSMYPLDNGSAAGKWRQSFLKQTISAYSAVAGMNLFFALLPIIQNIEFAGDGAKAFDVLGLTSILLLIAALYMAKEFISVVNSFVGADDAFSAGAGLMSSVGGRVKRGMGHATKFAVKTGGAFGKAAARGKTGGAKSFFKSLGGSALEGIIGEKDKDGNRKGGLLNTITTKGLGINYQDVVNETTSRYRDKDMQAKGKQERALRNARRGFEYKKEKGPDGKEVKVKHEFTDEEMQQLYKDSGISDKAIERIAKQKGVVKEDVEKSLELENDVNDKKKNLDKNAAKYQQMKKGENIKVGDQEVKDMDAKAKEDFLYRAENNLKYSESELSIDTVKAAHIDKLKSEGKTENIEEEATKRAREEINQKLATNKAIDEYTQTKQKASDSSKEFIDALKKVQKEDKVSKISIDDKDIENLSTSIENALNKDADISGIEFNKVIDKVNELQRSVENEIGKQLKKVAKSTEKKEKEKKDSSNKG